VICDSGYFRKSPAVIPPSMPNLLPVARAPPNLANCGCDLPKPTSYCNPPPLMPPCPMECPSPESYDCGSWASNFLGGLFATPWSTALFITSCIMLMIILALIVCLICSCVQGAGRRNGAIGGGGGRRGSRRRQVEPIGYSGRPSPHVAVRGGNSGGGGDKSHSQQRY
jgi:hypothetical protein